MRAQGIRPIVASAFVILGACQASGPVYQTYYLPGREITDATALVRAAETRCVRRANVQAEEAYDRAYQSVNVPRPSGNTASNAPLALSPTQSAMLAATRAATVQAQQAQRETWDSVMKACMSEAGFRQVTVCVSGCAQ